MDPNNTDNPFNPTAAANPSVVPDTSQAPTLDNPASLTPASAQTSTGATFGQFPGGSNLQASAPTYQSQPSNLGLEQNYPSGSFLSSTGPGTSPLTPVGTEPSNLPIINPDLNTGAPSSGFQNTPLPAGQTASPNNFSAASFPPAPPQLQTPSYQSLTGQLPDQPAPIESGPTPTFVPPIAANTSIPSWSLPYQQTSLDQSMTPTVNPSPDLSAAGIGEMAESAPTDLSHLVDTAQVVDTSQMAASSSNSPGVESLVVPVVSAESNPVIASNTSSGSPKWIFLVGGILVLIVAAASAYFILGVGQSQPLPTSLPAVSQPATNQSTSQAVPTTVPTLSSLAPASSSSAQVSSSSASQSTSALDLLKKRQGQ